MNHSRKFGLIGAMLASAALAAAQQDAPPAPPAPPAPVAAPTPQAAPMPPMPPMPPAAAPAPMVQLMGPPQEMFRIDREQVREMAEQAREQARQLSEEAREQARKMDEDARQQAQQARQQLDNFNFNFNLDPFQQGQGVSVGVGRGMRAPMVRNDNTLYGRGLTALDDHHYDQALDDFTEVVNRGGPKADGAIYWKAYTLNKLGRRDDALAAIAQLRTASPSSQWLEDTKALELEVKQASGKPVSPESEADDDLKLMALNGLSQSDPERTYPLIEKLLKGPASPKLKKKAIFVLATNSSPRAQQLLEQIARGNGNPDLQMTAIAYMVENKQQPNRAQVLTEIYASTSDPAVKRAIVNAFRNNHDYDRLLQIARTERTTDLRQSAFGALGDQTGNAELWQLFQAETSPEARAQIIEAMYSNGNTEKLIEVARTDKDPKVRLAAIRVLRSYNAPNMPETMSSLYASEQDPQVKRAIVNQLVGQRAPKALVDIYRKETDPKLKLEILTRLKDMHSSEANALFEDILK
jgi:tetratricopeptide (TPR) repeat protein